MAEYSEPSTVPVVFVAHSLARVADEAEEVALVAALPALVAAALAELEAVVA